MNAALFALAAAIAVAPVAGSDAEHSDPMDRLDGLLERHMDELGMVRYASWRASAEDTALLHEVVGELAGMLTSGAEGRARIAAAVNLHNAGAIAVVLEHDPVPSIQSISRAFQKTLPATDPSARLTLERLKDEFLLPRAGPRVLAVLNFAARGCPPLPQRALRPHELNAQLDAAFRAWAAHPRHFRFEPEQRSARVPTMFLWEIKSVDNAGGLGPLIAPHAPGENNAWLSEPSVRFSYMSFDWTLNDADEKTAYPARRFLLDRMRGLWGE